MLASAKPMMSAELFHIPQNPAPDGIAAHSLSAADGCGLRYALTPANGRPLQGSVVLLPGRNECIEKYFETIRDLSLRGFAVATLDWRGQGGSDRLLRDPRRGYVRSFGDYADDLYGFFSDVVLPDCRPPYYILAHSTGGLAALLAAPLLGGRVRRMVLSAPLLALAGYPFAMPTIRRLTGFLRAIGLGTIYAAGGARPREAADFADNKLTSDLGRYRRNLALYEAHPQLGMGGPTATWVWAFLKAADTVSDPGFISKIRIPTLLVAAGADRVVSNEAIEDYARRMRAGSLLTIDGARHEILQERDIYREQLLAAFDAFVPGSGETYF